MKRPVGLLLWSAGLLVVVAQLVSSGASSSAITFGSEITNASDTYSSVISIWYSEDSESTPEFICSGTLIQSDVVLTAAHCVLSKGIYYVKFGVDQLDDESELWGVSATWRNPQYSARQMVNDVGLLLLTEKITDAKVSALSSGSALKSVQGNKAVKYEIVGWGRDQNEERATYLRKTSVDDQTTFAKKIKAWAPWRNDVWFAVGKYNSKQKVFAGACSGDSGGPLFAILNGKRYLAGVTSWGAEDCEVGAPSVYSRLSYYADKIKKEGVPTLRVNEVKQNRALPSVITGPSITGEAKSGSIVECDPGEWSANTTDISISWSGPGVPYGSTSATLKLPTVTADSQFVCTVSATSSNGTIAHTANIFLAGPPQELVKTLLSDFPDPTKYADSNPVTCTPGQFKGAQQVSVSWWVTSNGTEDVRLTTNSGPTFDLTKSLIIKYGGRSLLCQVVAAGAGGTTQSNAIKLISPWPKPQIKTGSATLKGISGLDPSYIGQVLTCEGPTWTGGVDSQETKFYISAYPDNIFLSSGATLSLTREIIPKSTYPLILCEVSATNAGGTTTARSVAISMNIPPEPRIVINSLTTYLQSVTVNTPIKDAQIISLGGPVVAGSYSITPPLPSGLTLSSNGIISGTPINSQVGTSYTVTANNLGGSSTATFVLVVNATKPLLTISVGASQTAMDGTPIQNTQVTNRGGTVLPGGYSITPALPLGLTLNSTTGVISGTPVWPQPLTTYLLSAASQGAVSDPVPFTITIKQSSSTVSTTLQRVCSFGTSCTPTRVGSTAPIVDVSSIRIPSGTYTRGTKINISVKAQAEIGTTIYDVRINLQPFCSALEHLTLTLSDGTNTNGTYSGTVDTGLCKAAGEIYPWPIGTSYIAMYVSGGNGTTSFVAGEFKISNPEVTTTTITPPSEPFISGIVAAQTELAISWNPPSSNGGSPITQYWAYVENAAGVTVAYCSTTGALTCTAGGLSPSTNYRVIVSAWNSDGGVNRSSGNQYSPRTSITTSAIEVDTIKPIIVDGSSEMVSGWTNKLGQTPIISLAVKDNVGVRRVTLLLYAENSLLITFPATLYSGTQANGIWRANLEFRGSSFIGNWAIKAQANDDAGNYSGEFLLREVPVAANS